MNSNFICTQKGVSLETMEIGLNMPLLSSYPKVELLAAAYELFLLLTPCPPSLLVAAATAFVLWKSFAE